MNGSGNGKHRERLLIFPFDLMSHYLRCLVLARHYPEADIVFAASSKYDAFVHEAGYKTFPVEQFDPVKVMACSEKFDFSWLNVADIERVFLSQAEAIRKLQPDRVIGDTSPTLKMAAEVTGVPYTALMNGYMSPYYVCVRALSRTHPGHVHLYKLPPAIRDTIIRFAEKVSFRLVHQPFRKLRRKYRLKKVTDYMREMQGDDNLLCDELWLFPQRNLPANYTCIGPLLYKADTNAADDAFLSALPAGKKRVVVCMGSTGNWEQLAFLSSEKYSDYVFITAGDAKRCISGHHVVARSFVSLDRVLPDSALLICHGGNGTIHYGLKYKIPMVCLTSHFEQEWNVQRLEALGLGVSANTDPEAVIDAFLKRLPHLL